MSKEIIFVSSVQKELQDERYAVRDFVSGDDLFQKFFRVFLFEDLPPADRRADAIYLEEVKKSTIYIGIFGNEYGREDEDGISPTEKEFNQATSLKKRRLIFVKGHDEDKRHPKMKKLIEKASGQVSRKRVDDIDELLRLLKRSLIQYLQDRGVIQIVDFDAAPCPSATLQDISSRKLEWFLEKAREERKYASAVGSSPKQVLTHLNLLSGNIPTRGAILLFCETPQRFMHSADLTCLHFYGTKVEKPIQTQQVYKGTLFEIVDQAVDFVMARVERRVKPGDTSPNSSIHHELPYRAVREAVVNAVAHRDYASKSGIQVKVFSDRVEVWNPGILPEDLTLDQLRQPHPSVPRNHLLCEPLYLAHYIERAGTGTLDMIDLCNKAGLPDIEFRQGSGHFILTIWRDWLTEALINELRINDRQKRALKFLRSKGRITSSEHQKLTKRSRQTASRDLDDLVQRKLIVRRGEGRGTYYVKAKEMPHK